MQQFERRLHAGEDSSKWRIVPRATSWGVVRSVDSRAQKVTVKDVASVEGGVSVRRFKRWLDVLLDGGDVATFESISLEVTGTCGLGIDKKKGYMKRIPSPLKAL